MWQTSPNLARASCRGDKLSSEKTTSAFPLRAGIASLKVLQGLEEFLSCFSDMTLSGLHKIKSDKSKSKRGIRLDIVPWFHALNNYPSYGNMKYSPA